MVSLKILYSIADHFQEQGTAAMSITGQQKKTTHYPHGQQVVLYQISSIPDKTCRRLVQNWYRNEKIYILWNFIKRRYVCFLHFTGRWASSWGTAAHRGWRHCR